MTLNRKLLTGGGLAALAVLFVAAILISNTLLRGARLDLTQNRLYTLSEGTRKILASIDDPIHLHLFYSDNATRDLPQVRVYAQRVRDTLEEMVARSRGKLTLEVIDPQPFSEDEDRASAYGLTALPTGKGDENIYFGLAGTNSTNGKSVIPILQAGKETLLEYDVAKLIHELTVPKVPVIGLITGLPMVAGLDKAMRQVREPWVIETQLKEFFEVRELSAPSLTAIDPDINVLVVVHPKALSDDAQYAIDQFVMRGGRLVALVDPSSDSDESGYVAGDPRATALADRSSDLPLLFKAWGIEYDKRQVLLDRTHALPVNSGTGGRSVRVPWILGFGKRDLNHDDVITASLDRINLSTSGSFRLAKDSKYKFEPLVQTGAEAMMVPVERVKTASDPAQVMQEFAPDNERHIVAGRLEGKFTSAFPERKDPGHLSEAKAEGVIILIADTDLLSNRLWVQPGQGGLNVFANNGDLIINAIDFLTGSSDLMSIRGRAISLRPFTRVQDMTRAAETSFRGKERELQQQLKATERKLTEMQTAKGKQSEPIVGPDQQREIDSFMKKKVEIRKDLRQVRRGLDEQIDALGTRLKLLNIGLMPALITLGALGFALWRRRRT